MKKIIILLAFIVSSSLFSQVIIGDNVGTASTKNSVLLEFANTNNKGLVVPYVRTLPSSPSEGTILLDASNSSLARVKYYTGTSWYDLSGIDADVTTTMGIQPLSVDEANAKVIIGDNTSSADGALVLESQTKALVLPIVDDVNNIPSPSAGMLVYVNKTGAKRLAVFNGQFWSFWQP